MSAVYCWGLPNDEEPKFDGNDKDLITTARQVSWPLSQNISFICTGFKQTLVLTDDGKVHSCENNDRGQQGHDEEPPWKRPRMSNKFHELTDLRNYTITQITCGNEHSLALNNWGQIFSWGSDSFGQLGNNAGLGCTDKPKIIRSLSTEHVIQICCGKYHCMALTNNGHLYSWGANSKGQLGLGYFSDRVCVPTKIPFLAGIPVAFIVCGGDHSFVISKSGAVFGWGNNSCGQLGLNDENPRCFPTQLKTLRSLGIRYISCGEEFSAFLSSDGGVFTCGAGTKGQLGHGGHSNEMLPRKITELMGSEITQIACGNNHTFAVVPSIGRIYAFGIEPLGNAKMVSSLPQIINGPWNASNKNATVRIKSIFCGGDRSIILTTDLNANVPSNDFRVYKPSSQILCLTKELATACSTTSKSDTVDMDLLSNVESIFKSPACLNASFLLENDEHRCCTSKHHGIDFQKARDVFELVRKIENESLKNVIRESISNCITESLVPAPPDVETLRAYLILPLYHEFVNVKNYSVLHTPYSKAICGLQSIPRKIVFGWLGKIQLEFFERIVSCFIEIIKYIIRFILYNTTTTCQSEDEKRVHASSILKEPNVYAALQMLVQLHTINHETRIEQMPYDSFYMTDLIDMVDVQCDYIRWVYDFSPNSVHLCNFPFLFDAKVKTVLLQTDQTLQMRNAVGNVHANRYMSLLDTGVILPYSEFLDLNVSRDNLVQDTLSEVSKYDTHEMKKPLKIKFHNEEAEDAGGVRKEFFMLVLKELLDPKFGMFKEFEDSRVMWFSDISFESEEMYYLIGLICGLAIYNFTIINLPFPLALFKKLLEEEPNLDDLRELSPTMANSLQQLLDYKESDLVDVFGLNFEISRDVYGKTENVLLKPEGDKISVSQDNKQEFVDLYVNYIFNKSVAQKYDSFHNGLMKVCGGRVLKLFRPHELMDVVIGNENYDWHVLQGIAKYKNGYSSSDCTIQWFWEVIHELPLSEKKKFLLFLTGSDRIPIQGMKEIQIYIQPTTDTKCLPVAHTCFNLLDLPRYETKERLKFKLTQAIQQTQCFSLV